MLQYIFQWKSDIFIQQRLKFQKTNIIMSTCQLSLFLIVLEAINAPNTKSVPLDFRLVNTFELYFDSTKINNRHNIKEYKFI